MFLDNPHILNTLEKSFQTSVMLIKRQPRVSVGEVQSSVFGV